jgi:aspartyl-tRNA(Asn)/glutamyl-tRNA(Gln) amidotransferase subunit B
MNQFSIYKPIIGLEIHVELKTKSKMFCQCSADYYGKSPNTQVCPVCLGMPGALPVPNKKAIEDTIFIGKALNCQINKISKFDRKHYFYPDLPKGYQISQYDQPLCFNGFIDLYPDKIESKDNSFTWEKIVKRFRIRRVHLEEDTGKLVHAGNETLIDFNRSGVPLVEIVTEPDFHDSSSVKRFLEELQVIIRYLGVSDCDMEKGTMRLEPNISIQEIPNSQAEPDHASRDKSQIPNKFQLPNYKVEIKNINSFRFVKEAIDYEINRQISLLKQGKKPIQETRGYDEKKGTTYSQRDKEEAYDYRYFPEPDIPPLRFEDSEINEIKLPLLPNLTMKRLISEYNLRYYEAFILTRDKTIVLFFDQLLKAVQEEKKDIPKNRLAQTIANLIVNKKINLDTDNINLIIKSIIDYLEPKKIDQSQLELIASQVIKENEKAVRDYKEGKKNALMFLVGMVMKKIGKRVDAKLVISQMEKLLQKNN